jgi:hypothetical protein
MAARIQMSDRTKQVLGKWYSQQILAQTPVIRDSFWGWLFGLTGRHAVTINKKVHLTRHANDPDSDLGIMLLGHELFHVEDQQRAGWRRYLFRYILRWRPQQIRNGRSHSMEKDAYNRGDEIWHELRRQL